MSLASFSDNDYQLKTLKTKAVTIRYNKFIAIKDTLRHETCNYCHRIVKTIWTLLYKTEHVNQQHGITVGIYIRITMRITFTVICGENPQLA